MRRCSRAVLLALASCVGACGTPQPAPTATPAASAYLAAVSQVNAALDTDNSRLLMATTVTDEQAGYARLAGDVHQFASRVRGLTFSGKAASDRDALLVALAREESAFRAASTAPAPTASVVQQEITAAVKASLDAANTLRADLGLPQASG